MGVYVHTHDEQRQRAWVDAVAIFGNQTQPYNAAASDGTDESDE